MTDGVLIAGGNGSIGRFLAEYLTNKGFGVSILSRKKPKECKFNTFYWNIDTNYIDTHCFEGISHIIQLSGANIAEKRWTPERKNELIQSRVKSTNLLFEAVKRENIPLKSFVTAGAVGFYGAVTDEHIYTENDAPGTDFLAQVCVQWENAANQFNSLGIRTGIVRTGIVLMPNDGAMAKLMLPAKFGLAAALGSGKQFFPWIHILDLCGIYHFCLINSSFQGPYNAVAPETTTNTEFTKTLCKVLRKPFILPNIPAFLLKIALGELATTLLSGSRISSVKIIQSAYHFKHPSLVDALKTFI